MTSASFDFAPVLAPGLPAPAAKWTGLAEIQLHRRQQRRRPGSGRWSDRGGDGGARARGHDARDLRPRQRPARLSSVARVPRRQAQADGGIACSGDEILITSGSLQALDLVNGLLLARGDTVLIEQESYQGSLNRLTRLGVKAVGIPLDGDGMRMDAVATALADLKSRGIRPKYIYTIPTVQNPTGTIMGEQRRLELLRLSEEYGVPIFEDDCYADLIWDGRRPPAIYAMSKRGGVIHIGSFSKSIAPALRVGYIVAPWEVLSRILPLKTDAGSGALEQMVLAEFCAQPFRRARAEAHARPARQARDADGRARRAVRHRGRVRGPQGRHLPVGQAARRRGHAEACAGGAGEPASPSIPARNGRPTRPTARAGCGSASPAPPTTRSARASRCSRRSAGASSACLKESPMWSGARRRNPLWRQPACSSSSTSAPRKSPGWMNAMRSPATLCCGLPPPSTRTPSCVRPRTVSSTSSTPRQKW